VRLFLDANVLFTAAHNPSGKAALVIELAGRGYWEAVTSSFAIEEARRNLEAKFPLALPTLASLTQRVSITETHVEAVCPIELPEKDRPIFLAAVSTRCTHLLTGDIEHFGPYMNAPDETSGVIVQTVGEFLSRL
jgi:predicted nucleic acid-binding protein